MSQKSPSQWNNVQDPDVLVWLSADSSDEWELIVEVRLPERKVTMQKRDDGSLVPTGLKSNTTSERAAALVKLHVFLTDLLDVPPVLLKAAGAIAVRATPVTRYLIRGNLNSIFINAYFVPICSA